MMMELCYTEKCPVCQMGDVSQLLQLSGVCEDSIVDRFYIFQSSSDLLGLTRTRILFSEISNRWEIVERSDSLTVLAFTNSSHAFPLGSQRWYFDGDGCTDPEQKYRTLNLHLEEGMFWAL